MQQSKKVNVCYITFTAVMAALVFVFTFTFKIPLGTGYTHLGDMMIFLAAWLLGGKKAAPAAGLGACLADLALGYAAWMAPTFIIKCLAVAICCLIAEKAMHRSLLGYGVGAVAGGAFQIGAYTLAKVLMYDKTYALTTLPELAIQTAVGIAVAGVLVVILTKSGAGAKLQRMAGGAGKEAKAA